MSNYLLTRPFISSSVLHRPDVTSLIRIELWNVMYLCHKIMTMYCCVKTIWIVVDLSCCVWRLYVLLCKSAYATCFGGSPFGEAVKTCIIYTKNPTDSSINRGIYGHVARAHRGAGPHYIRRLRVTEEYILIYSSVTCDRRIYSYIPQYRGI
jgi:hypothetical protein